MIIKKKKNNDSNNNNDKPLPAKAQSQVKQYSQGEAAELFDAFTTNTSERQERRRGDRRRGYRRIEDRSLVSRAHEEAKIIREQAAKDGFQNGIAQASSEITNLQSAVASLLDVKKEALEYYKNDIAEIALLVARKILNTEVKSNPETIMDIVKNVIKEVSREESKIIFVINPADELVLNNNIEHNSIFANKKATISIQTDEDIEQGSCKVITSSGQIDATFTSQLNIIKKAFAEGI
jgi:flagellar biosynthesis/type III secretory pathway protein FliH